MTRRCNNMDAEPKKVGINADSAAYFRQNHEPALWTCRACGTVGYAVSRQHAKAEVENFNNWYNAQPPETREHYGRWSRMEDYERCRGCGALGTTFRPYVPGDCPAAVTLAPVVVE